MNKVMVIIMIAVIDRCYYHYDKTLLTLEGKFNYLPLKNT